jgi:anti-sigma B factor antagonist
MPDPAPELIAITPQADILLLDVAATQLSALKIVDRFDLDLRKLLEIRSERYWIMDFRSVTFLVTPAVNTLLQAVKKLRARGGDLALCGLSPPIRRLFGLMKLDRVFLICESVEAALAGFRTPP